MSSQLQNDLFLSNNSYEFYNFTNFKASNASIYNLIEESKKTYVEQEFQYNTTFNLTSPTYFETFIAYYSQVHGYLSLIVCIFGIIANLVNILVLTRKEMRSPTNYILTGLAIADLLVMVDYVPFNIHNNIQNLTEQERLTWFWSIITLLHMHVSIVFHTVSCWLTILLAVWRYLAVSFPTQTKAWLTQQKSLVCIIAVYIIVPICCIPLYLSFNIFEEKDYKRNNASTYRVEWSELAKNNSFFMHLNIWVFSVGTKLVPCVLLTYLSFSLIHVLIEADKRKRRLQGLNQRKEPLLNKALINEKKSTNNSKINQTDLIEVKTSSNSNNECLNILVPKKNANSNPVSKMSESNTNLSLSLKKKTNQESDLNNNKNQKNTKIKVVNNSPDSISPKNSFDKKRHSTGCISNQSIIMIKSKKETLLNSKKNKNEKIILKSPTVDSSKNTSNVNLTTSNNTQHSSQSDRTTKMLISVLLLFLMTEFPSGILVLLSSILGQHFFDEVYQPLGSLLDLLALINSAVNFVLYCSMSKQFRSTFSKLILRRKPKNEFSNISKLKPKNHRKKNSFK